MRPGHTSGIASVRARWIAVALVAAAILLISVVPIPGSVPEEGGGVPISVLFHFSGYAVLAATMVRALSSSKHRRRSSTGGAVVGASGYGALVELIQFGLPYRTFSYLDMVINASGAAVAPLVVLLLVRLRRSE